jgi:Na+/proline symporter
VVVFGLILGVIALACQPVKNILWFAFKIFSVTGGAMLGVYLLGLLTKRKANWANVVAMIVSTIFAAALLLLSNFKLINLAWSWIIVIGTGITFIGGYVLGPANGSLLTHKK